MPHNEAMMTHNEAIYMIAIIIKGFLWPSHDSKYFMYMNSLHPHNNPIRFDIVIINVTFIYAMIMLRLWGIIYPRSHR